MTAAGNFADGTTFHGIRFRFSELDFKVFTRLD